MKSTMRHLSAAECERLRLLVRSRHGNVQAINELAAFDRARDFAAERARDLHAFRAAAHAWFMR